ncbi:Serine/threonine-protein phosphatase 7 long form homolog [Linum perenne]
MRIEHDIITALVERWKPNTHNFHMLEGESIVTLKYDFFIIGLLINGSVIFGWGLSNVWTRFIHEFLGHQHELVPRKSKVHN